MAEGETLTFRIELEDNSLHFIQIKYRPGTDYVITPNQSDADKRRRWEEWQQKLKDAKDPSIHSGASGASYSGYGGGYWMRSYRKRTTKVCTDNGGHCTYSN